MTTNTRNRPLRYRRVLDRRTLLRGAGGVAIALPFLEEMTSRSLFAAPAAPPASCITVFFGNGIPVHAFAKGLTDLVAPWKDIQDRMGIHCNVDLKASFHPAAAGTTFRGYNEKGPSIDQYIRDQAYPGSMVPTRLQTFSMGSFFRTGDQYRHIHSYNKSGAAADQPVRAPKDIFERLFGGLPGGTPAPTTPEPDAPPQKVDHTRSVLDVVLKEYQHYMSEAGGLGADSREKIRAHLDRVRELESSIVVSPGEMPGGPTGGGAPSPSAGCKTPGKNSDAAVTTLDVPTFNPQIWEAHWRKMADLYAMGLHCDLFRFGNVVFTGAAERVKFDGPYDYNGSTSTVKDGDNSHNYWHAWNPGPSFSDPLKRHIHFVSKQVVYFLKQLDDRNLLAADGQTYLQRNLVVVSTELDNHSNMAHSAQRVFHAVSGAAGRLKVGVLDAAVGGATASFVDFYETCLEAVGVQNPRFGDARHRKGRVAALLA